MILLGARSQAYIMDVCLHVGTSGYEFLHRFAAMLLPDQAVVMRQCSDEAVESPGRGHASKTRRSGQSPTTASTAEKTPAAPDWIIRSGSSSKSRRPRTGSSEKMWPDAPDMMLRGR